MSFLATVSTIESLKQPHVSLSDAGIQLSYENAAICNDVYLTLNAQCMQFGVIQNGCTLTIAHRLADAFIAALGANQTGLKDLIDLFYIENSVDRARLLAYESRDLSIPKQHLPDELLSIEHMALGPRPNQLLAKLKINIPSIPIDSGSNHTNSTTASRVTFILDNSGSMNGARIEMLKSAINNTLPQLPESTLISIYFYNNTVQTIMENKRCNDIGPADYIAISSIRAGGRTNIASAIEPIIENLRAQNVFNNPSDFENLTMVWLTDGDDDRVGSANDLAQLFLQYNCPILPRLIAVGVGDYNTAVLNGVAQDIRFKSNLMLHIENPDQTNKLFQVISHNVGIVRRRVILAIDVDNQTIHEDLATMQTGQSKTILMEIPCSTSDTNQHISCRILLDDDIYQRSIDISAASNSQNPDLLVAYYEQVKTKVSLAMFNAPDAAKAMRALAVVSIPAHVSDNRLRELRRWFLSESSLKTLCNENFKTSSLLKHQGLFSPPPEFSQQAEFSNSLQMSYSDNFYMTSFN